MTKFEVVSHNNFLMEKASVENWILSPEVADELLNQCAEIIYTEKRGGRLSAQFGCDYKYSGRVVKGQTIPQWLEEVMEYVNELTSSNFNSCLVNKYPANIRTGIGFHKDNEPELLNNRVVSISLGQEDTFILRGPDELPLDLQHGDILLMDEELQLSYYHGINYRTLPKDRISLTFREFK